MAERQSRRRDLAADADSSRWESPSGEKEVDLEGPEEFMSRPWYRKIGTWFGWGYHHGGTTR